MPQIEQLPEIFASQLFWLLVVFSLIFFVIGRWMLPAILSTPSLRTRRIAADLERAAAERASAELLEAEWREKMDVVRSEAAAVARQARWDAAAESDARIKAAIEAIDLKADQASERIQKALAAARGEVEAVAAEAAQQIVRQLTGIAVDKRHAADAVATALRQDRQRQDQQARAIKQAGETV